MLCGCDTDLPGINIYFVCMVISFVCLAQDFCKARSRGCNLFSFNQGNTVLLRSHWPMIAELIIP